MLFFYCITIGSNEASLREWSLGRKFLTHLGYVHTRILLDLPFDGAVAYRSCALDRIPKQEYERVPARDWAFFFQSLQLHFTPSKTHVYIKYYLTILQHILHYIPVYTHTFIFYLLCINVQFFKKNNYARIFDVSRI